MAGASVSTGALLSAFGLGPFWRWLAPVAVCRDDHGVPSDYPESTLVEPEPVLPPKFGPRAVGLSVTALIVGWLVFVWLDVSGRIGNRGMTIGCGFVLVVVGYFAYMWQSRHARWAFAAKVSRAEVIRRSARRGRRGRR
jgi:hypothetical protein